METFSINHESSENDDAMNDLWAAIINRLSVESTAICVEAEDDLHNNAMKLVLLRSTARTAFGEGQRLNGSAGGQKQRTSALAAVMYNVKVATCGRLAGCVFFSNRAEKLIFRKRQVCFCV